MVIGIDRGHSNNLSTLGTCEVHEVSSWWNFSIMQNHKPNDNSDYNVRSQSTYSMMDGGLG